MPTEWPPNPAPLTIDVTDSGDDWCRMTVSGEFDMAGSPAFRRAVNDALGRGRQHIAVDTSAVRFMDSTGLTAVLSARVDVRDAGGTFRLTAVSSQVARLLNIAGLTYELVDGRGWRVTS